MEEKKNLYEKLKELEDFRRGQGQMHSLAMVLVIVTMAIMSGYEGQRAKKDFIKKHRKELIKIFKPKKNRLPSYQTIARILENIDFEKLVTIFYEWTKQYIKIEKEEWISLDGKAIKGTVKNAHNKHQEYTNLVTVFLNKRKEALIAKKVGDKKSEIPVVKELIKILDLEGVIFTIDALHCQKETTKIIKESKNDYVIGVKGNQNKLYKQVKKTV
jgi:hypothetical protein